jgi:alkanesulfonate monooxygenase SsuD/methylene tetrahydromethanopterin reductase-like flavin-dependent oxidoreductase (luciferase family)
MTIKFGVSILPGQNPAEVARELEAEGYDYATAGEHIAFNVPATNSFITLAVAAGATTRIGLMGSVCQAPVYPAMLLAKLSAELDVASGGRFSLGVGVGGEHPPEYEACGVSVKERGARTDEALTLMQRLFHEDHVHFDGRFCTLRDITLDPKPLQSPLPLWVSGRKDAAMRRAARFASGWLPYMYTPEALRASLQKIAAVRDAALPPIEAGLLIWVYIHPDREVARRTVAAKLGMTYNQDFDRFIDSYCAAGPPAEVIARLGQFISAGARTLIVSFACPLEHIPASRKLFNTEVLPALRGR